MSNKKAVSPDVVNNIAQNMFCVLPLLRKRLIRLDAVQDEHNIPLSHVQVLTMLSETGSLSVSEISRRLGIAKPNITPLVDRLIEMGLVERSRDNTDRRVVNVLILPAGQQKLQTIRGGVADQVQEWICDMPAATVRELNESLGTLARILMEV